MKVIVAVIIYNRFENLKRWLHCWKSSVHENAELIIIHNVDGDGTEILEKFSAACEAEGVQYVPRANVGYDIGAFQDVCRGRLAGFPVDWDYLLWCTDDTLPMRKDFLGPFLRQIWEYGVGISCMKISASVSPHVRTTGFCLARSTAARLVFPADPIIDKGQCYFFEHRGGVKTLTNQVRQMGLDCRQVEPSAISPLWDQGYWRRLDRKNEFDEVWGFKKREGDLVTFICPIYNSYPQIISSLIMQTHKNWELLLIHDGPNDSGLKYLIPEDARIKYIETKERVGNWGHKLRQWALEEIHKGNLSDPDYVVITNADNYHTPVYIEYLLNGFKKSHTAVAAYGDAMVHSYKAWQVIPVRFERGFIDCAGVMIKKEIACEVGWRDISSHSSDWTFFSDIAAKYSIRNFIPVKGCLLVHN